MCKYNIEDKLSDEELSLLASMAVGEEVIDHAYIERLSNGESPTKIYREWRGLSQKALAKNAGISISYLALIERKQRNPSQKVKAMLAKALKVDMEDIEVWSD